MLIVHRKLHDLCFCSRFQVENGVVGFRAEVEIGLA